MPHEAYDLLGRNIKQTKYICIYLHAHTDIYTHAHTDIYTHAHTDIYTYIQILYIYRERERWWGGRERLVYARQ